jgi:hypothetical protein
VKIKNKKLEIQSGKPETKEIFVDKFSELA